MKTLSKWKCITCDTEGEFTYEGMTECGIPFCDDCGDDMEFVEEKFYPETEEDEIYKANKLIELLKPGLKFNEKNRVDTSGGDKTPLGLYRTIKRFFEEE